MPQPRSGAGLFEDSKMQTLPKRFRRFFYGFALSAFASGTVVLVTDPYKMADIGLIMLGLYLMVSGLQMPKAD